jgi:phage-related protein
MRMPAAGAAHARRCRFVLVKRLKTGLDSVADKCQTWHTMSNGTTPKPLFWMGSSKKDLNPFPDPVQDKCGFALWLAQTGTKHPAAKPLKGFKGADVLEIVEDDQGSTYRAVYTVRFAKAVYMLHAFQKKSKKGIKTPKQEVELIEKRLQLAEEHYAEWSRTQEDEDPPRS